MNKALVYLISGLFLAGSVVIMTSGQWLKSSYNEEDDVLEAVRVIEQAVKEADWTAASANMKDVTTAWDKVTARVQYSVERDLIDDITEALYMMKGAIAAKDTSAVLQNTAYFYVLWEELGS